MATKKKKPEEYLEMGRPTKYRPEYCEKAIEVMSQGFSLHGVAAECGKVSIQTIYNWMNEYPDFFEAIKTGSSLGAYCWEKINMDFARSGVGNATAIVFGLKNRGGDQWRDKQEVEHSGTMTTQTIVSFSELPEIQDPE